MIAIANSAWRPFVTGVKREGVNLTFHTALSSVRANPTTLVARTMRPIPEWTNIDVATFEKEVATKNQPAVLRNAVNQWPIVNAGKQSVAALCNYLRSRDSKAGCEVFIGPPEIQGRFWYGAEMRGFNFERRPGTVSDVLEKLLLHKNDIEPPAIYLSSAPTSQVLPQFAVEHVLPMIDAAIEPRIWIGNGVRVQTHFDISENIACVVYGNRRFTLFPPDEVSHLYVGPLDFTMAGQPVSMVQLEQPDFAKYPEFSKAFDNSYTAELLPGDAIYIPYMWWHHVQSLSSFNVLVNYWWNTSLDYAGSPFEALVHAILAVRSLSAERRAVWKQFFSHFVFEEHGDPAAHLGVREKGIMHSMSPQLATYIKNWLLRSLTRN